MTATRLCEAPNCGRPTITPTDPFCALHEADRTAHAQETLEARR